MEFELRYRAVTKSKTWWTTDRFDWFESTGKENFSHFLQANLEFV